MEIREGEDRIITMPNILSLFRILMIPFIYISFARKEFVFAGIFIILSGLTDLIDGYAARRFGDITKVGKILDPIADKLTQVVILIGLVQYYPLTSVTLVIFVLKELSMGLFNLFLMHKGREYEGAVMYGKVSTFVFYICMILVFLTKGAKETFSMILLVIATAFLLYSWIGHMIEYTKQYKEFMERGNV